MRFLFALRYCKSHLLCHGVPRSQPVCAKYQRMYVRKRRLWSVSRPDLALEIRTVASTLGPANDCDVVPPGLAGKAAALSRRLQTM